MKMHVSGKPLTRIAALDDAQKRRIEDAFEKIVSDWIGGPVESR